MHPGLVGKKTEVCGSLVKVKVDNMRNQYEAQLREGRKASQPKKEYAITP